MLAISLLIFGAILYVVWDMTSQTSSQISIDAAFRVVEEINEAANFVYVHGHPSMVRIRVHVPSNVENITLSDNLIKLSVSTGRSYTDVYDMSKANITLADDAADLLCPVVGGERSCREGTRLLSVESLETGYDVNITVG